MIYVIGFLLWTLISWISLLIIIPISRKLADFSMPPWPETLWKLAVVAASGNLLTIVLNPVNVVLSWVAGAVVFFVFMVKWFHVDLFGAVIIVVVTVVVRIALSFPLAFVLAAMRG